MARIVSLCAILAEIVDILEDKIYLKTYLEKINKH